MACPPLGSKQRSCHSWILREGLVRHGACLPDRGTGQGVRTARGLREHDSFQKLWINVASFLDLRQSYCPLPVRPETPLVLNRWSGLRLREEVREEVAVSLGFPGNGGPQSSIRRGRTSSEQQGAGRVEILWRLA